MADNTIAVVYTGPAEGVTLAPAAGGYHFPAGVPVEVPKTLARSLLEQGTFRRHTPPPGPSRSKAGPDVESR